MDALLLPGHDDATGNRNSFLFRSYPFCAEYVTNQDLKEQHIRNADAPVAMVHSYGFWAFVVGYQLGLFPNVKQLVVFDGWFPANKEFNGVKYEVKLPPIPTKFFFPTFGDRSGYPLESIVHQVRALGRKDLGIFRGIGFGHNLLFGEFDEAGARDLVALVIDCGIVDMELEAPWVSRPRRQALQDARLALMRLASGNVMDVVAEMLL